MNRRYLLHLPSGASGPLPLVLAFHGNTETTANFEEITGFNKLSDRESFIVAYPEGIDRSWADGRGTTDADKRGIDDVGFAKAVVADIAGKYMVDRARVYATGASNGGILAHRLGCEAADTFVAIAPVIASIAADIAPKCKPAAPISVLGIQGVADPLVSFEGAESGNSRLARFTAGGEGLSSRAAQDLWRSLEGCQPNPTPSTLPVRVKDGTSVTRRAYTGCRDGVDVVWYEIQGGGHRWPPHRGRIVVEAVAKTELGLSSQNIDASEVVWTFFSAHHR
jgi:polyhydroxybutyrate depolymerase